MVTKRKNTWDLNRAAGDETLRMYESGTPPKQIAAQLGLDIEIVWHRIKLARKRREQANA